ncbi:hypothetical protein GLAREA_06291 [Glarea lozoyensis ATCC 20868]|uniref:Magnesium transport protein CorA, transmembrane region n=1 Tax=Glarea lozoyensis (strain ATCC 20868 / MF5171) TaxID=1116229 RepID=S3D859_GLAL2|nr:uncharacterized protein GLAREA_06291 [Glarea lozoyensis ATCC 20868]EPE33279.1 hypothetical protein GLAREA_06291 [Glarea lozoyensis ATCC 20868]
MDWARDNVGLSAKDLDNVFKYEEKSTVVVRMMTDTDKKPEVWSLREQHEWEDWASTECPRIDGQESGLVLILAKRAGEKSSPIVKRVNSDNWLAEIGEKPQGNTKIQRASTFSQLGEAVLVPELGLHAMKGKRGVRTLPFSKETFQLVAKRFHIHASIARAVSRADVPLFSSAEIQMNDSTGRNYPAIVYNCRTSNAWDLDLAFTSTYFPHCGLTFAVLFGCTLSVEGEVLRRLGSGLSATEASHPLLIPGILVELERSRHIHIVEATIDHLETKIFELNGSSKMQNVEESETEKRNEEKRSAWLDTTYLRNGLISWNTQLAKIAKHAEELTNIETGNVCSLRNLTRKDQQRKSFDSTSSNKGSEKWEDRISKDSENCPYVESELSDLLKDEKHGQHETESRISEPNMDFSTPLEQFARVGYKIHDRVQSIIDEYDDKIRDCTMRVDGMAMATQWAQGETNVEIAYSTSKDSSHMRSIALVTMIFLPGTFFATVFSMTFFNWSATDGQIVSSYFWIYIVVAVACTVLTVGVWWYFVTYRQSKHRQLDSAS